jgi:CTP:molybdopterin cytidylyltransferase MocA
MKVAALVLAAGRGRRMGEAKAAVRLGGRTFLEMLLAALRQAGADPRLVVVAPDPGSSIEVTCAAFAARLLVNPSPAGGMLSSLHVGLDALASDATIDALLVAPVDCPRVRPETIAALVDARAATGAPIVVPRYRGRRGHPALFASSLFGELRAASPAVGARSVLHAHAADRCELDVDDAAVLDDFDTPAAVDAAQPVRPAPSARRPSA